MTSAAACSASARRAAFTPTSADNRLFGERLAVLELTDIYSGSNRQAQGLLLLYVYDPEDGLIFAERLSSPLAGRLAVRIS